MNGLVGVKNSFDVMIATDDVSSTLKREALLLDKTAFHGFELVTEDKPSTVSEEVVELARSMSGIVGYEKASSFLEDVRRKIFEPAYSDEVTYEYESTDPANSDLPKDS